MVGRLILGLLWLTCVQSDSRMPDPSMSKMSMAMSPTDETAALAAPMSKAKRYLSHQHSSPCPPFYPHFGMHMPMYAMRPYGPPAYPKNGHHMPIYPEHHQHHQPPQFIHQPSYTSYVPKQTIQYVKPAPPVYHHPVASPPIHHLQPVHPIVKDPPSYYHYQQPMIEHHKPVFAYAPAYHKPMPMYWPTPDIKKIDYPIGQVAYHKPAIVYKPEAPKCAPCPPPHQPPQPHYHPQSSISYVKIAQPIVQQVHSPSKVYLPAPAHQPIKPCDK